jgi:hypothetical protein
LCACEEINYAACFPTRTGNFLVTLLQAILLIRQIGEECSRLQETESFITVSKDIAEGLKK